MQKTTTNNKFKTLYWYGERYYCGMEVDAALRSAGQENADLKMTLRECHANLQTIYGMYNNNTSNTSNTNHTSSPEESSDYWNAIALANVGPIYTVPICIEPATDIASAEAVSKIAEVASLDSPRSVISGSGSLSYDGGSCGENANKGARGRAVGKRNQEIYLPDGVKISHIAEKYDSDAREMVQYEWIGRYDQSANVIVASQTQQTQQTQQMTYETLKHFAQEHDRETYGENYTPDFTTNVWKNPMFKFYNTVACAWEPLSSLRA